LSQQTEAAGPPWGGDATPATREATAYCVRGSVFGGGRPIILETTPS
jgi:hypothetical protein